LTQKVFRARIQTDTKSRRDDSEIGETAKKERSLLFSSASRCSDLVEFLLIVSRRFSFDLATTSRMTTNLWSPSHRSNIQILHPEKMSEASKWLIRSPLIDTPSPWIFEGS